MAPHSNRTVAGWKLFPRQRTCIIVAFKSNRSGMETTTPASICSGVTDSNRTVAGWKRDRLDGTGRRDTFKSNRSGMETSSRAAS